MSIEILQITDVVARLKANVPGLVAVEGAAELGSAMKQGVRQMPTAFVMPLAEDARTSTSSTQVITQKIISHFAVVCAVKDVSDQHGEKAIAESLRNIRLASMTALAGWAPNAAFDLCQFEGGSLFHVANSAVFWRDKFATTHTNES